MQTDHEHYEELGVLIVSGQASETEVQEYADHAQECADCRRLQQDFAQIAQLVTVSDWDRPTRYDPPAGMTERFVAHARAEGVPLAPYDPPKKPTIHWFQPRFLAAAALLVFVLYLLFALGLRKRREAQLVVQSNVSLATIQAPIDNSELLEENARLQKQLHDTQLQIEQVVAELNRKRKDLETATGKAAELDQKVDGLQQQMAGLRQNDAEHSSEIARLQEALNGVTSQRDSARLEAAVHRNDVSTLRTKLAALDEELQQAQHLSAAANQAKDMLGARKLHVVDVHDNENGNRSRPFGRVFYAEGKKLVFYAYDLGDPKKLSAKVSFYVWGEKAGVAKEINLGVFRTDDEKDSRWVLTVDDPRVLTQINTIFVTSESINKKIVAPSGKRILTAFLDDDPNHP